MKLLLARDEIDINATEAWLIKRGAKVPYTVNGWTALMYCTPVECIEGAELLLERNEIDVNVRDRLGRTALILAAEEGNEGLVRLLLAREDVMIGIADKNGQTAAMMAEEKGHIELAKLIRARRAKTKRENNGPRKGRY